MSGKEAAFSLPAEGGRTVCLLYDVYVLRLQCGQEAHHLLGVLAGYGASQICKGCYVPGSKNRRTRVYSAAPLAVPFKGNLYFFLAGFHAL